MNFPWRCTKLGRTRARLNISRFARERRGGQRFRCLLFSVEDPSWNKKKKKRGRRIGEKKIRSFGTSFVPFFPPPPRISFLRLSRNWTSCQRGKKAAASLDCLAAVFKTSFLWCVMNLIRLWKEFLYNPEDPAIKRNSRENSRKLSRLKESIDEISWSLYKKVQTIVFLSFLSKLN